MYKLHVVSWFILFYCIVFRISGKCGSAGGPRPRYAMQHMQQSSRSLILRSIYFLVCKSALNFSQLFNYCEPFEYRYKSACKTLVRLLLLGYVTHCVDRSFIVGLDFKTRRQSSAIRLIVSSSYQRPYIVIYMCT